jgi:peptidoglycan/xylan/chitin deacetylase (PgdA/CDA1 family)
MPDPARLYLTTSWDDGHPADERLADLLERYGIGATFYVPELNREDRPVLTATALRELGHRFEIGGHSQTHIDLTSVSPREADREIRQGKQYLEDVLGKPVAGFCYPCGGVNKQIRDLVEAAGFRYARTTRNLFQTATAERYLLPTTCQFYPHSNRVYLSNYLRHGHYARRAKSMLQALSAGSLSETVRTMTQQALPGACVHIWGHSWEIEENDLWGELEEVLSFLSREIDDLVTGSNAEIYGQFDAEIRA